ncbi:hypothetical protein [Phaeovulum sp.]|uniref:hypothetical protein n=1 Tax=Phaeovulum sp. TaxID=2934796 RepID=UPI0035662CC5
MRTFRLFATVVLALFPIAAFANECSGDDVAETLSCPSTLSSSMPGGGCVIAG